MSSLLRRLAGQALGASGPRIRSAAHAHAQVPIVMPAGEPTGIPGAPFSRFEGATSRPEPHIERPARDERAALFTAAESREHRAPTGEGASRRADRQALGGISIDAFTVREPVAPAEAPTQAAMRESVAVAPPPMPLLSELAPIVKAQGSPILPTDARPSAGHSSSGPTEVHIHIGRIEVTAVHAPALAPKRHREPSAPRTLPLADYLARRRPS